MLTKLAIELTEMEKRHANEQMIEGGLTSAAIGAGLAYPAFKGKGALIAAPVFAGATMLATRVLRKPMAQVTRDFLEIEDQHEKETGEISSESKRQRNSMLRGGAIMGIAGGLNTKLMHGRISGKYIAGVAAASAGMGGVLGHRGATRIQELRNARKK